MKNRLGAFLAATLLAGVLAIGTSVAPASAHTDVCAGKGTASVGSPLFYPGLGPAKTTSFNFTLDEGACLPSGATSLSASGTISGLLGGAYCGQSTGTGTAAGHHAFSYVSAGTMLVLTGGVVGTVNAIPDATTGESCVTGADRFIVTGSVALG